MAGYTTADLDEALRTLASMLSRCEKAQEKFSPGSSQYTLQQNRLSALRIALSLTEKKRTGSAPGGYTKDDLQKALAPVASLISKSEKAREKLAPGSWQHTMLGENLKALYIASPLLSEALNEATE